MLRYVVRNRKWGLVVALFAMCAVSTGCSGRNTLPSTVVVELPDGTTVEVQQGGGVASLANSTWEFFQTAGTGQGIAFMTIVFGVDGELVAFQNNTLAPEIFGTAILFDGAQHSTTQEGFTYSASTYGAETSDGTGFSFEGRLAAFAAGFQAGLATATASGTFDPGDANTMTGTFSFESEITLPIEIPGAEMTMEFAFIAHRVLDWPSGQ